MATRQVKQTSTKKPAWEGQVREAARQLGVSEAKLTRQVKRELIQIVAEQIAKDAHQRVQDEKYAPRRDVPAGPPSASKAKVRHVKVVFHPTIDLNKDGGPRHPDQSPIVQPLRNSESTIKNGVRKAQDSKEG